MKAVRNKVLVQQTFTKIVKNVITLDDKPTDTDRFKVESVVIGMGAECPTNEVKIGDKVFMNKYAEPQHAILVSNENDVIINNSIFDYDNIIAISDND